MKKLLFVFTIASTVFFSSAVTPNEAQTPKPVMQLTETIHDMGKVVETDGKVSYTFNIQNTGNADLLLTRVQGTCGCTVADWTKTPIPAGKDGIVSVSYDPKNRFGDFNKKFSIFSNSSSDPVTVFIKGTVVQNTAMQLEQKDSANCCK